MKIKAKCKSCGQEFTFDPGIVQQEANMVEGVHNASQAPIAYLPTCPRCNVQQRVKTNRR